jgi:hypothetical protein
MDTVLSTINLAVCSAYVYVAIGEVYAAKGMPRLVKSLTLALAVFALVLCYRFLVFLITLYST